MKKIICICICICISLTAGCGKQPQTKPMPNVEKQQIATSKENKKLDTAEKEGKGVSEVLETSKSFPKAAYEFAKEHWIAITAVTVAAIVLCAVGYKYDVFTKDFWGYVKDKFKKAPPEEKTDDSKKKKPPEKPAEEKKDEFLQSKHKENIPKKTGKRKKETPPEIEPSSFQIKPDKDKKKRWDENSYSESDEISDSEYEEFELPKVETIEASDISSVPETVITEVDRKRKRITIAGYKEKYPEVFKKKEVVTPI